MTTPSPNPAPGHPADCRIVNLHGAEFVDDGPDLSRDLYEVLGEAEALLGICGLRSRRDEQIYEVCLTPADQVTAVSSVYEYADDSGHPTIEFSIAVHPAYQGKGLGTELIRRIVAAYHGHAEIRAWVVNPDVISILERLGFEWEGTPRPDDEWDGWRPDDPFYRHTRVVSGRPTFATHRLGGRAVGGRFQGPCFVYEMSCTNAHGPDIDDMARAADDVDFEELALHCANLEEKAAEWGYASTADEGLTLVDDWGVSFHRSVFRGRPCYYVRRSGIEFIWTLAIDGSCGEATDWVRQIDPFARRSVASMIAPENVQQGWMEVETEFLSRFGIPRSDLDKPDAFETPDPYAALRWRLEGPDVLVVVTAPDGTAQTIWDAGQILWCHQNAVRLPVIWGPPPGPGTSSGLRVVGHPYPDWTPPADHERPPVEGGKTLIHSDWVPGAAIVPPGFEFLGEISPAAEDETLQAALRISGKKWVPRVRVYRHRLFYEALIAAGIIAKGEYSHPACEFVLIPGGSFLQGSPHDESHRGGNEGPQRRVTVPPFLFARTAVVQAVWERLAPRVPRELLEENVSRFRGALRPAENLNWFAARAWSAVNDLRLPSESEWEYACRAGTTTPFAFGATITTAQVNYDGNYPYRNAARGEYRQQTVDVGTLPPNAFGLFEVHGNVWEWCQDTYQSSYEDGPTDGSAWEVPGPSNRVNRGGSWYNNARLCRSAKRVGYGPGNRHNSLGFRPAASLLSSGPMWGTVGGRAATGVPPAYSHLRQHLSSPRPLPARVFRRLFATDAGPLESGKDFIAEFNAIAKAAGRLTAAATIAFAYRLWDAIMGPSPLAPYLGAGTSDDDHYLEEAFNLIQNRLHTAWSSPNRADVWREMTAADHFRFRAMVEGGDDVEGGPPSFFSSALSMLWTGLVYRVHWVLPESVRLPALMAAAITEAIESGYLRGAGLDVRLASEYRWPRFDRLQLMMLVCEPVLASAEFSDPTARELFQYRLYEHFYSGDMHFVPASDYPSFGTATEIRIELDPGVYTVTPNGTLIPLPANQPGWIALASERDAVAFDLAFIRDQMWARLALIRTELAATVPFHYDQTTAKGRNGQ